jgi:5-formyltetrahydrofolate cyclo-ligase
MNTSQLRKRIRQQRRQLSRQIQLSHGLRMAKRAKSLRWFLHSKRIAFYLANDGEMDPKPLIEFTLATGKQCYLPILRQGPSTSLWFAQFKPGMPTQPNRFGIPEPASRRHIVMPWGLDLIFLPLVAFDSQGNRMGMGGGYYDRTLSFIHQRKRWKGPKLVGLAHELQRVNLLNINSWDIPLDAVLTESSVYLFNNLN